MSNDHLRRVEIKGKHPYAVFYDTTEDESVNPPRWILQNGVFPQKGDHLLIDGTYYKVEKRLLSKKEDTYLFTYVMTQDDPFTEFEKEG